MLTQRGHQFYRDSFGTFMSLSKLIFSPVDHGCWGQRAVPRDAPYRRLPTKQESCFIHRTTARYWELYKGWLKCLRPEKQQQQQNNSTTIGSKIQKEKTAKSQQMHNKYLYNILLHQLHLVFIKVSSYLKMVWRSDCLTSQESPSVQENCQQTVTNCQLNEFSKPNHSKGKL